MSAHVCKPSCHNPCLLAEDRDTELAAARKEIERLQHVLADTLKEVEHLRFELKRCIEGG